MNQTPKKIGAVGALRELPELPVIEPGGVDWLETPEGTIYSLSMDTQGENLQHIGLTREEFIVLKRHLATLRGQKPLERSA